MGDEHIKAMVKVVEEAFRGEVSARARRLLLLFVIRALGSGRAIGISQVEGSVS
jgi:hypothetical protein